MIMFDFMVRPTLHSSVYIIQGAVHLKHTNPRSLLPHFYFFVFSRRLSFRRGFRL